MELTADGASHSERVQASSVHRIRSEAEVEVDDYLHPAEKEEEMTTTAPHARTEADLEKGAKLVPLLLNVGGMDCSTCANKLTRALQSIPGVSGVTVVFVNGTAELDIDPDVVDVSTVVERAQHMTGYRLEPYVSEVQVLDVIMNEVEARTLQTNLPSGVVSCERVAKAVYAISYDPDTIGPRDLLSTVHAELAAPREGTYLDADVRKAIRLLIMTSLSLAFTVPIVAIAWGDIVVAVNTKLIAELVLGTLVQVIAGFEFYKPAISSLVYHRVVEMDMLVVISITAAFGYSVVACGLILSGVSQEASPFFETSTLLISLILLGRFLSAWARRRAVKAVSVRSLQVTTASLEDGRKIDARLLQLNDMILIEPHSQIVTDATVISGRSEVDESMLTGESVPVFKSAGASLVSGTLNGDGTMTAQVSRLPGRNTITDIANLVEQAQKSKPRVQDLADKIAGYFVPVVCTAALIVFVVWIAVGIRVRGQSGGEAARVAIGYCIAVLAVSCPCALGLAVPMVLVISAGVAARGGIVIKTADTIERGHRVTDVIFDKTGTLTHSELEVTEEQLSATSAIGPDVVRGLIMSMTSGNQHPASQAIAAAYRAKQVLPILVEEMTTIAGYGVQARWQDTTVRIGSARWLDIAGQTEVAKTVDHNLTTPCVTVDGVVVARIGLRSRLRSEAAAVVGELQRRGIEVHVVSGDTAAAVEAVAQELKILHIAAEQSPAQKQEYVHQLMEAGKVTLFCGDGTNDAVAIAQANIGVQVESSSDVTRATADVVLLNGIDGVIKLLDVSRSAFRRIVFNFGWSATYNVLAILLAGGAFVKVRIPPAYAGLGEIVSVMPVIVAALTQPRVTRRSRTRA